MYDPHEPEEPRLLVFALAIMIAFLLMLPVSSKAQTVPVEARSHQRELTRIIQQEWGLGGSAARAAAQIHQESAWRADVGDGRRKSSVGAEGLAQFMPATAKWIVEVYPDLGPVAPFSYTWAFRAMARYDGWLFARTKGHTHCDRWWFTLRAYNGGEGHLRAEARNGTDPLDRVAVDAACGTARRSVKHCPENLGYPERILHTLEPIYLRSGWSGRQTCPLP